MTNKQWLLLFDNFYLITIAETPKRRSDLKVLKIPIFEGDYLSFIKTEFCGSKKKRQKYAIRNEFIALSRTVISNQGAAAHKGSCVLVPEVPPIVTIPWSLYRLNHLGVPQNIFNTK